VRHEGKRSILNFIATALAGCREDAIEHALTSLMMFSKGGQATVIGRAERLDALSAAFLNAASGNVFDFDDTHLRTVIHPTAPVAPALFALAEMRPVSGRAWRSSAASAMPYLPSTTPADGTLRRRAARLAQRQRVASCCRSTQNA
jgi:2-methylcitrate dehydratase PrpD